MESVSLKEYISKSLEEIDDAIKERDYKTCVKEEAHMILELQFGNGNIVMNIKKTK